VRTTRLIVVVLTVTTSTLGAAPVLAQGAPTGQTPPDTKAAAAEAKARLAAGDKAAKAKEWETALREYTASNTALKSSKAQMGVGEALFQMRRHPEAFEAFDDLIKTYGTALARADRKKADDRMKELAKTTGYLSLRVSESGAQVNVDGKSVGLSPVAALMRVSAGAHKVQITKEGFLPFEQGTDVAANGKAIVDVTLTREPRVGHVVVKEKTSQAIRVSIDGVDVGPAPHEADLEPGPHEIGGRSATLTAPKQVVEVVRGKTHEVELAASAFIARLEIRTSDNKGLILLDGKPVAEGSFAGEASVGPHLIVVTREGYERYENRVNLADKQTLVETVTLKRTGATLDSANAKGAGERSEDGVYGGLQAMFSPLPFGTDNSLETSCDALGATSCTKPLPMGGTLGGYVGYSLAPVGFELFVAAQGDVASPKAIFDGVKGSEINPLVAAPAREESFQFVRFGGYGAVRVRASWQTSFVRLSAAGGLGLAVKSIGMLRDARSTNPPGGRSAFEALFSKTYVSPGVSAEVTASFRLGQTLALALGANMWVENAPQSLRTTPRPNEFIGDPNNTGGGVQPIATPAYDMANGAQVYLGPFLGLQFGP